MDYNKQTIGFCSLCGGAVTLPIAWWGTVPPVPTCEDCGATKREHGPVVEMEPAKRIVATTDIRLNVK